MIYPADKKRNLWVRVCLVHLSIVALLGTLLRSKILFPIAWLDFKYLLNTHSHFAFGGWVTLMLMTLLVFEVLPEDLHAKKKYTWALGAITVNAWGMLICFPFEGYAFLSILFSTLFIFASYFFSWVYVRDILRSPLYKPAKLLILTAIASLVISSVGPFTLAYLLSTHSGNFLLYKNAVYTYLHFQYNGFFTLAILGILLHRVAITGPVLNERKAKLFSVLLCISILPSAFLSYLWQYPASHYRIIALVGALLVLASVFCFVFIFSPLRAWFTVPFARTIATLSLTAFILKMVLQSGTIIPVIGDAVFGDRPVIIGFLHLVFLGFVSLFAIAYLFQKGVLSVNNPLTKTAAVAFTAAVIFNELVLMLQGLGIMFKQNSVIFAWLLWFAAIGLLLSSFMIALSAINRKATG